MRRLVLLLTLGSACAPSGAVVRAPALGGPPTAPSDTASSRPLPDACAGSWAPKDMEEGPGRVVAVCGSDVRRVDLDAAQMSRAIGPALKLARERVCACAARLRPPPFVDLVVTSRPDEGRATARSRGEDDAVDPEHDWDPELGPPFAACIGTAEATFPAAPSGVCPLGVHASIVYPVRVDLTP